MRLRFDKQCDLSRGSLMRLHRGCVLVPKTVTGARGHEDVRRLTFATLRCGPRCGSRCTGGCHLGRGTRRVVVMPRGPRRLRCGDTYHESFFRRGRGGVGKNSCLPRAVCKGCEITERTEQSKRNAGRHGEGAAGGFKECEGWGPPNARTRRALGVPRIVFRIWERPSHSFLTE